MGKDQVEPRTALRSCTHKTVKVTVKKHLFLVDLYVWICCLSRYAKFDKKYKKSGEALHSSLSKRDVKHHGLIERTKVNHMPEKC